ncbi:MAG TPA: DoxX family protein [Candidatus Angelobacter sp.]|nr:DoxX family protein [Candidatus Angelobacter sp.]
MQTATPTTSAAKKMLWAGRIISGLVVALLLTGFLFGLLNQAESQKQMVRLGYPANVAMPISIVFLVCILLYAVPRTAIFGAVMLTAYLGGATATHVRAGEPFFIPIIVGVVVWVGIYLREERLRALAPLRR